MSTMRWPSRNALWRRALLAMSRSLTMTTAIPDAVRLSKSFMMSTDVREFNAPVRSSASSRGGTDDEGAGDGGPLLLAQALLRVVVTTISKTNFLQPPLRQGTRVARSVPGVGER